MLLKIFFNHNNVIFVRFLFTVKIWPKSQLFIISLLLYVVAAILQAGNSGLLLTLLSVFLPANLTSFWAVLAEPGCPSRSGALEVVFFSLFVPFRAKLLLLFEIVTRKHCRPADKSSFAKFSGTSVEFLRIV